MKNLLFMISICLAWEMAYASEPGQRTKNWLLTYDAKLATSKDKPKFIKTIMLVDGRNKDSGYPSFPENLNYTQLNQASYLKFTTPENFRQVYLLNFKPWLHTNPDKLVHLTTAQVFTLSGVDAMLAGLKDETDWKLVTWIDDKPRIIFAQKGNDHEVEQILHWIEKGLIYDGVVLDQKKDFVLVAAMPEKLVGKRQALAIANSQNVLRLDPSSKRKGAALLNLMEADGSYGIFKIVVAAKGIKLPPGTKLIIESKK